jgi:hypothetical protein
MEGMRILKSEYAEVKEENKIKRKQELAEQWLRRRLSWPKSLNQNKAPAAKIWVNMGFDA